MPRKKHSDHKTEHEILHVDKKIEHEVSHVDQVERDILRVEEEQLQVLRKIEHNTRPRPQRLSTFSIIRFTGDVMADNNLVLNVGQTALASPATLLADGVTDSGATYSAATYTFSDPSATVVLNPDGITALVTGVAPSTGPVSGSVAFTATDTDGAVSTWNQTFTISTNEVVPPPPAQLSQSAVVHFSTPA